MQSDAKTVDEYLHEVPEDRLEPLKQIRQLCLKYLIDYTENMEYGMPTYRRESEGEAEVAFASQKNNIALYILKKEVLDRHRHNFSKSAIGKGCIRYTNPQKIDFQLIETMLIESYESQGEIC